MTTCPHCKGLSSSFVVCTTCREPMPDGFTGAPPGDQDEYRVDRDDVRNHGGTQGIADASGRHSSASQAHAAGNGDANALGQGAAQVVNHLYVNPKNGRLNLAGFAELVLPPLLNNLFSNVFRLASFGALLLLAVHYVTGLPLDSLIPGTAPQPVHECNSTDKPERELVYIFVGEPPPGFPEYAARGGGPPSTESDPEPSEPSAPVVVAVTEEELMGLWERTWSGATGTPKAEAPTEELRRSATGDGVVPDADQSSVPTTPARRTARLERTPARIPPVPGYPTGDEDRLRRVFPSHHASVQYCYEKLLKTDPTLTGSAQVTYYLSKAGKLQSVQVVAPGMPDARLGSCISQRALRMTFPPLSSDVEAEFPAISLDRGRD